MFNAGILLFILSSTAIIHAIDIILNFNEKYHPLIVTWIDNQPYAIPSQLDTPSEISFPDFESLPAYIACPAEDDEERKINDERVNHKQTRMILFAKTSINQYCKGPLLPSITITKTMTECGTNKKGIIYLIGYWMTKKNNRNAYDDPQFIELYEICYMNEAIFTKHFLHPNQGLMNHKISQDELEKLQFETAVLNDKKTPLKKTLSRKFNSKKNEKLHQLVPYNDMLPVPWKTTTLFDINVIYVSENVKSHLEEINDWIRNFIFYQEVSLRVFTGTTSITKSSLSISSERKWFWKVLIMQPSKQGNKSVDRKGIAIGTSDQINNCDRPCEYDETIFKEAGIEELNQKVRCLFACKIDRPLIEKFGLVVQEKDSRPQYLETVELLNLTPLTESADKRKRELTASTSSTQIVVN